MSHAVTGYAPRFIVSPDGSPSSVTGTTSETVLKYLNLPSMGANGAFELDIVWDVTGVAGTWQAVVRIITGTVAGTVAGSSLVSGTLSAGQRMALKVRIFNRNSQSSQMCVSNPGGSFTASTNAHSTAAIDTSSPFTVSINGKLNAAGDALFVRHISGLLIPG